VVPLQSAVVGGIIAGALPSYDTVSSSCSSSSQQLCLPSYDKVRSSSDSSGSSSHTLPSDCWLLFAYCCRCWLYRHTFLLLLLRQPHAAAAANFMLLLRSPHAAATLHMSQVQEVVLLEVEGAKVSHAGVSRAVSSSWGGDAVFTVLSMRQQQN
jgi:hypothetical protein